MKNMGLEYHTEQIIPTYTTVKMKHAHCMGKMTILKDYYISLKTILLDF
jgi:hypothetical protein